MAAVVGAGGAGSSWKVIIRHCMAISSATEACRAPASASSACSAERGPHLPWPSPWCPVPRLASGIRCVSCVQRSGSTDGTGVQRRRPVGLGTAHRCDPDDLHKNPGGLEQLWGPSQRSAQLCMGAFAAPMGPAGLNFATRSFTHLIGRGRHLSSGPYEHTASPKPGSPAPVCP